MTGMLVPYYVTGEDRVDYPTLEEFKELKRRVEELEEIIKVRIGGSKTTPGSTPTGPATIYDEPYWLGETWEG